MNVSDGNFFVASNFEVVSGAVRPNSATVLHHKTRRNFWKVHLCLQKENYCKLFRSHFVSAVYQWQITVLDHFRKMQAKLLSPNLFGIFIHQNSWPNSGIYNDWTHSDRSCPVSISFDRILNWINRKLKPSNFSTWWGQVGISLSPEKKNFSTQPENEEE